MTAGQGCPFYSKDVTKLLDAMRRRELREGTYTPSISQPVMSRDYVMFGKRVSELELNAYKMFASEVARASNAVAEAAAAADSSDDDGGTRQDLEPTHHLTPIGLTICDHLTPIGAASELIGSRASNHAKPIGCALLTDRFSNSDLRPGRCCYGVQRC